MVIWRKLWGIFRQSRLALKRQCLGDILIPFPGSTLQPSEYEDKTGMLIRHYYVDCHPYYDRLPPEKSDNFQYDEYPSAIHVAACIDQASKELDELLFGGGYGENGEGHASPIILY